MTDELRGLPRGARGPGRRTAAVRHQAFDHAAETGLRARRPPRAAGARLRQVPQDAIVPRRLALPAPPVTRTLHKGTLGTACATCHTTAVPFADARTQFDHAKAKFQLTGAHRTVECARCHVNKRRSRASSSRRAPTATSRRTARCFGPDCTVCHTTDTWRTQKVDHARTAFPLTGAHATVACATCHVGRPSRCASSSADVPRLPRRRPPR